jgi:hypothetical protein
MKKGTLKIFPGNIGDGGGGGRSSQKIFRTYQKIFRRYHIFSPKCLKNFPGETQFYPKITKFFSTYQNTKTNAIINQRPLGKKCNLNDIFHGGKGHFAPGKGHF